MGYVGYDWSTLGYVGIALAYIGVESISVNIRNNMGYFCLFGEYFGVFGSY